MVTDKFKVILGREQKSELILLLRSLTKEDKKELAASLKTIYTEYMEYRQVTTLTGTTLQRKASVVQATMIPAAAFACMNRKDFEKIDRFEGILRNQFLFPILEWYCPDWFSDYVNGIIKQEWLPYFVTYDLIMRLTDAGHLRPGDELIARLLPQAIIDHDVEKGNSKAYYRPQNLLARAITLQQHIWLLFRYDSNVANAGQYLKFDNLGKSEENIWVHTLKHLVVDGKIERMMLLRESLLGTSRNFDKTLSGWFVDVFEALETSPSEITALQPELFVAINSQHSRAINLVLSSLKQIVDSAEFDVAKLMENLPLLLSSETKSIVSSTLVLLEKVIRKHPARKEEVCIAICQALIHSDEAIQNKVAKLLLKHHNDSTVVLEEINKYRESMLMSSRKSLAALLAAEPMPANIVTSEVSESPALHTINPLQETRTIDELIFLASQAFDNNDPMHIDLLAAAFVNLQYDLTESVLPKFEPALQRACNLQLNGNSAAGFLDNLLASFFVDLMKLLISRHPKAGESLQKVYDHFEKIEDENKKKWIWYKRRLLPLATWRVDTKDTTYNIHKAILVSAYDKIAALQTLPLLSTPTHEYGYVDPLVLVNRLSQYQSAGVTPQIIDYQVAISRILPFNYDEALAKARSILKDEDLRLIEFLLTKDSNPVGPFLNPVLWFMAGVTRLPGHSYPEFADLEYSKMSPVSFTGDVSWRSGIEHSTITQYNFQKRKNEEVPIVLKVLRLKLPHSVVWHEPAKETGILSKIIKLFSGRDKKEKPVSGNVPIIYELLTLKGKFLSAEHNDIQRFIYLFPNNPNPLLALVAHHALVYSKTSGEIVTRLLTNTLEALVSLRVRYCEMTHLFVASCMLSSDKTVRSFAAEMWTAGVSAKSVDSALIGRIIGTHVSGEYAPLKRFTDLVSSNLINVSPDHNRQLERLLTSMMSQLLAEPPVGMKRLLELFSETMAINNSSVTDDQLKSRLEVWSSSQSLKKIISSIT